MKCLWLVVRSLCEEPLSKRRFRTVSVLLNKNEVFTSGRRFPPNQLRTVIVDRECEGYLFYRDQDPFFLSRSRSFSRSLKRQKNERLGKRGCILLPNNVFSFRCGLLLCCAREVQKHTNRKSNQVGTTVSFTVPTDRKDIHKQDQRRYLPIEKVILGWVGLNPCYT